MTERQNTIRASLPILTLISIAVFVFLLATSIHEIAGHAGATIALGGKPLSVSTTHFDYDKTTVQRAGQRAIDAAGSAANIIAAATSLALLRLMSFRSANLRIFLWLLMNVNIFIVGGYLLTPFIGLGDWARFVDGLEPGIFWKIALTAAGGVMIWIGIRLGTAELSRLLSLDPLERQRDARLLTLVPYLGGSAAEALSGIMSPLGFPFGFLSATISGFGRQLWLVFFPRWVKEAPKQAASQFVQPNPIWLIVGVISLITYVGLLGPGVKLAR
jgi:hypothetical protein